MRMKPTPKVRHPVVPRVPFENKPRMRRQSMSAGMQDGVVEGVGVDKASDNHCSLFLPLKNRHGLPLSRYLRYLLTCPLPFLSIAKSMKYLYSSKRSDATSSLIHSSPSHTNTHRFQCGNREADPTSGLLAEAPVLFMLAHTAQFAILLSVIMWASGIAQLSHIWSDEAIFDAVVSQSRISLLSDSSKQKCVSEQRNKLQLSL